MGDSAKSIADKDAFTVENEKAEQYIDKCDFANAAKLLVPIVEKDPQNWRAFNNMGIISWMRQAWSDAYTMFKKSVELKPDYADALVNLFDAALKLRRIEDALPLFEKALKVNPDLEEIQVLYNGMKEEGENIYSSERALKIGAYNPEVEEANALLKDGNYMEAMEKYLQINDTQGPNAEVFCGLGIVSYYQQRYDDALTLFYESIKLNPANSDIFLNFLDAAKKCDKEDLAKSIFAVYLKEFPFLESIKSEFEK